VPPSGDLHVIGFFLSEEPLEFVEFFVPVFEDWTEHHRFFEVLRMELRAEVSVHLRGGAEVVSRGRVTS
jgi:hypothetical protein